MLLAVPSWNRQHKSMFQPTPRSISDVVTSKGAELLGAWFREDTDPTLGPRWDHGR